MSLRALGFAFAGIFALTGVAQMHGQAAAEYGAVLSNSAGAAATVKTPPVPSLHLPSGAPNANTKLKSGPIATATPTTGTIADMNRKFFEDHSGANAGELSLQSAPDHAQVWVDEMFVGVTPLALKLAPGEHRVFASGANKAGSVREFVLAPKQTQSIDLTLKSSYQGLITIQGSQSPK